MNQLWQPWAKLHDQQSANLTRLKPFFRYRNIWKYWMWRSSWQICNVIHWIWCIFDNNFCSDICHDFTHCCISNVHGIVQVYFSHLSIELLCWVLLKKIGLRWVPQNIDLGNGLVPSGNKPSPGPLLTTIYDAIWCNYAAVINISSLSCSAVHHEKHYEMESTICPMTCTYHITILFCSDYIVVRGVLIYVL